MVKSQESQRPGSFLTNIDPLEMAKGLRTFLEMLRVVNLQYCATDVTIVLCSEENSQGCWDKPLQEMVPTGSENPPQPSR